MIKRIASWSIVFVAMTVGSGANAHRTACDRYVSEFLTKPTERRLAVLNAVHDGCWTTFSESSRSLRQLYTSVATGNRWSALYLARNFRSLDGGELKDSIQALGSFGDRDPIQLLLLSKSGVLSKSHLGEAVTALPDYLADKTRAQLAFLQARRARYAHIARADLREQRAIALAEIDGFIVEVQSHI